MMINKGLITVFLAFIVAITLMLSPASAVEGTSADRTLPGDPVEAGTEFEVTLNLDNYGGLGQVTETLPDGFTFVSSTGDFDSEVDGNEVTFTVMGASSITYTVEASDTEETYEFMGTITDEDKETSDVTGDTEVSVVADGAGNGNGNGDDEEDDCVANRTISSPVNTGEEFDVTLNLGDYGGLGQVTETLPDGFTFVNNSSDAFDSEVDGNEVTFTVMGASSITYTVEASGTEGTYDLIGSITDEDKVTSDVCGDTEVEVTSEGQGVPDDCIATRSLPDYVDSGEEFDVTLNLDDYGGLGQVTETLPDGLTFVSSDAFDSEVDGNEVTFTVLGASSITYTVEASDTEETYEFMGTITDADKVTSDVCGDNETSPAPDGMVLYPGMQNMVSVPYALENSSVDHVFGDVNYTAVSYWDASEGMWQSASELEPLKAYQVIVPGDYEGTQVIEDKFEPSQELVAPASMSVEAGNTYAVGYTGTQDSRSIADTLNPSIEGKYGIVTGPYINGTPVFSTTDYDKEMSQFYGYWVSVNEDGTLNGFGYSME